LATCAFHSRAAAPASYDAASAKAITCTGTTLVTSIVFWLFLPLKFEAERPSCC